MRGMLSRSKPFASRFGITMAVAVSAVGLRATYCAEQKKQKKKRVAIYGGALDPITNDHLRMASEIARAEGIDEVWIVPCGPRPDKPSLKTPAFSRYCMCQIAVNTTFSPKFPVKVDSSEIFDQKGALRPQTLATYDLLAYLRQKHPDNEFVFVVGSDWLQPGTDIRQWDSADHQNPGQRIVTGHKLISEFDFLVLYRPGYEVEDLHVFGPRFSWLKMPPHFTCAQGNLSSSEIRRRAKAPPAGTEELTVETMWDVPPAQLNIDGLVCPGVVGYIERNQLYK